MLIRTASILVALCVADTLASTTSFQPLGIPFLNPVVTAPGFTAHVIFSNLTTPRGITFDDAGNLLVVERGLGVTAFTEAQNLTGWERTVVVSNPNFTQGIQVDGKNLYVSTAGEVLLYDYNSQEKKVLGSPKVIINDIPPDGELTTHTLQLQKQEETTSILIASGPFANIDPTARNPSSGRSQIRRINLNVSQTAPQSYFNGDLLAFGIRNPAGFAFSTTSPSNVLYVVENGASIDNSTGLTPAFVNDNPADELEKVELNLPPKTYGFPDCTTLWNPFADPVGDPQFTKLKRGAQFSLHLEPGRGNKFCNNRTNNEPPILSFQAHSVPLDIKFYEQQSSEVPVNGFPQSMKGDAFVSFHGSFNRVPPTGYGVVHVPFGDNGPSGHNYTFIVQVADLNPCPGQCIRPVGLAFDKNGRLFVSSDSSGEVLIRTNDFVRW